MKWEYRVLRIYLGHELPYGDLRQSLNDHGAEGWEIATTLTRASLHGITEECAIVLKRPIVEPGEATSEHAAAVLSVTIPR